MYLNEVTVLDFTHLLPGPFATQVLADLGATVIKVEPPGGEGARQLDLGDGQPGALFKLVNRGKQSVALNLKAEGSEEAVSRLFAEADAVLEQFRPGVAEELGIGYETATAHTSELVYCSLTGYGQTGPYRDRPGHDLNYVGLSGLLEMTRSDGEEPPVIPGVPVADMAGGLYAALTILSGLLSRELGTQSSTYIDVSMTDVGLSLSQALAASALFDGEVRPGQTLLTGKYPCYGVYESADGNYVTVAAIEPQFWGTLCTELDRPALVDAHLSDDPAVRQAVRETLSEVFRSRTAEEWEERLGDTEAMFAPVKRFEEALQDPQIRAREMVQTDVEPPRLGFPAKADGIDAPTTPPPSAGEHTEPVLRLLGFGEQQLEELRDSNVIS